MQTGDKVYYTGDMANSSAFGEIVRMYDGRLDIEWDPDEFGDTPGEVKRPSLRVYECEFKPAPGRRFWLLDDWKEDRRKRIEAFSAFRNC